MKNVQLVSILICLILHTGFAQNPLPSLVKKENGAYSLEVKGKPFTVLGAQLWNSSTWPGILDKTWPQLKELGCNTLEAPIYWQNIEPEQGKFNFKELDYLINGARREGLKLILLWFGSFKNGSSQYPPEWVLNQPAKYPRVKNSGGEEMLLLSTISKENLNADKNAFVAVMKHLKQVDGNDHTVIMVQVQNEAGFLGTDRDYSTEAEQLYHSKVPAILTEKLNKKSGNWVDVFGLHAAESFSTWHLANYINEIAAAGKKEYNLPMYVNAWPKEHGFQRPGEYPSGGPVSHMINLWKLAAPAISLLAVDIYLGDFGNFSDLCNKYSRKDNPLFIPEMGKGPEFAKNQFYALANYNAIGVALYGIDPFHADPNDERNKERLDDKFNYFQSNYRLLKGAIEKISELQGTGKLQAVGEEFGLREQLIQAGDYSILFTYGFPGYKRSKDPTGRAILAQLAEDEFLLLGFDTKFQFKPTYGSGYGSAEIILAEEGYYKEGKWIQTRIWNGDELWHSTLTPDGTILKIKLRKTKKAAGAALKANFE